MRINFSSHVFIFTLLLSIFIIAGNSQNTFALTPVADLTGEWSGFAQVYFTGTPCETAGRVNGYFTQNENKLRGEFSFVPTTGNSDCSYESIELVVLGTIDGSRISLYDHDGMTFSGWYASSGIKLDFTSDWATGTTQLSPTGFNPQPISPKDTIPPVITVPSDMIINITEDNPSPVKFSVSSIDETDGSIIPICTIRNRNLLFQ